MSDELFQLETIRVASPCKADWNAMTGDEQVRFCQSCQKNVYNLSKMPRVEAEKLVRSKEGSLCIRFFRREDGTILTADCPVGLRAVRRRLAVLSTTFVALLGAIGISSIALGQASRSSPNSPSRIAQLVTQVTAWLWPPQDHAVMGAVAVPYHDHVMGDVAIPDPSVSGNEQ